MKFPSWCCQVCIACGMWSMHTTSNLRRSKSQTIFRIHNK